MLVVYYQRLFEQEYGRLKSLDNGQNDYGLLVYSLQKVFEQVDYDITGDELAGSYHNQIVGMIGECDFQKICQGFIWNFTMGGQVWPPYSLQRIVDGELNYGYELSCLPTISVYKIHSWTQEANKALKIGVNGKQIVRRGKRYQDWLCDKSLKACKLMLEAAGEAVSKRSRKMANYIEEAKSEDVLAVEVIARCNRTLYILDAFRTVGSAEDRWGVANKFQERVAILEKGLASRKRSYEYLEMKKYNLGDIVENSVQGALRDLWQNFKERNRKFVEGFNGVE